MSLEKRTKSREDYEDNWFQFGDKKLILRLWYCYPFQSSDIAPCFSRGERIARRVEQEGQSVVSTWPKE
jgi:hypothetical protein